MPYEMLSPPRVLLIAPQWKTFDSTSEAIAIIAHFPHELLRGNVTWQRVVDATDDEIFDIIHFASHMDIDGLALSENDVISPDQIARIATHTRAKLVYINTCHFPQGAQYLIDHGVPAVMASTVDKFAVKDAWQIATYFYNELARNGYNMHQAFNHAKPGDGSLMWLSNGNYIERDQMVILDALEKMERDRNIQRTQDLAGLKAQIDAEVANIKRLVRQQGGLLLAGGLIVLLILLVHIYFTMLGG
jgi:hypothetical protein